MTSFYSWYGVEWNGKWNGMKWKFRYGIWKMPEWNGMEDFKNGMEDNLPYFHTNSKLDFVYCMYRKIHTDHTCQLSRFGRETPDFEDFSRSPDLNQKSPDLAQDFLNLKINQFFEKLINFVRKSFFLKGKEHTSIPASTDFIFFKSLDLKINV